MTARLSCLVILSLFVQLAQAQKKAKLIQYVDPLVGTANSTTASALKHGEGGEQLANTIPAVGVPFAMTQWTAQTHTSEQKCLPPYSYKDNMLSGFRGTHWLSGSCTQDYGSFTIMPVTGSLKTANVSVPFSHSNELANPDYYSLSMPEYHLTTEITAAARCGMMRFTLSRDDSLYLLVMPNSDRGKGFVKMDKVHNEIVGYNPAYRIYQGAGKPAGFNGYFVVQIQKQMEKGGVYCDDEVLTGDTIANKKNIGAYAGFKLKKGERLIIRIGTSFSSIAEARKNLQAEMPDWDFDRVRQKASQAWEKGLQKIQVQGTPKNKRIFYTAMYHTMQLPRLFNDVDGTYPEFSHQYTLAKLKPGQNYYDDYSMWDIYRAELPLYEILDPKLVNNLVNSIIQKGKQGGWIPIFPCWNSYTNEMIGDHSTAFIASAYLKGIKQYNVKEAYRLMRQNAFDTAPDADYQDGKGRRALQDYIKYGYIPVENPVAYAFHNNEQVSRTLEYAYDDYALAMVAKALNKNADHQKLISRSKNYKNVFDSGTGYVRGKHADGAWVVPFNPDQRASYITEGTPRQYTFYVPQDIPGLTRLMGGKDKLETALDSLFITGEYWHGNEPGHQIPFMYNFTNAPWKTQKAVRKILDEEYTDGPGGLSGNDDAGQISAWYIFGALGFYPVDPVSGRYMLSSPAFQDVTMQLQGNKQFRIRTYGQSKNAIYIRDVKLNGKAYTKNFISYKDIMNGGKLEIYLQDIPQTKWGITGPANTRSLSEN